MDSNPAGVFLGFESGRCSQADKDCCCELAHTQHGLLTSPTHHPGVDPGFEIGGLLVKFFFSATLTFKSTTRFGHLGIVTLSSQLAHEVHG